MRRCQEYTSAASMTSSPAEKLKYWLNCVQDTADCEPFWRSWVSKTAQPVNAAKGWRQCVTFYFIALVTKIYGRK